MRDLNWFNNKTIIVTNAENKVARILLYKLIALHNCKVIAISDDSILLKKLEEVIKQKKNNLATYRLNKSSKKEWQDFSESLISSKTDIDCLINFVDGKLEDIDLENLNIKSVEKVFKDDFYSSMYAINTLLPLLKKSNTPAIINIVGLKGDYPNNVNSMSGAVNSAFSSYISDLGHKLGKKIYVSYFAYGVIEEDKVKYKSKLYKMFVTSVDSLTNKMLRAIMKKKRRVAFGLDAKLYDRVKRYLPGHANSILEKFIKIFVR